MRTTRSSGRPRGSPPGNPPEQTPPEQTPPWSRHPPGGDPREQTPPRADTPQSRHPPGAGTPPVNRMTDACENITLPQLAVKTQHNSYEQWEKVPF